MITDKLITVEWIGLSYLKASTSIPMYHGASGPDW